MEKKEFFDEKHEDIGLEENLSQPKDSLTSEESTSLNVESKFAALEETLEKYKTDFLYLQAEFENYKRNAIKERSMLVKYGSERFIKDLLNVLDIFDTALKMDVHSENFQSFVDGVRMTSTELQNILKNHNVTPIESQGERFDPTLHEALGTEVHESISPGHITQVFKKPFKYHDKVIRHGQVMIAKGSAE